MQSNSFVGKRAQLPSASKAKCSVLSELSGLENVLFNDFIEDELDSAEDVSEHPHAASGWRIHCGVEVTELSTNKQHSLSRGPLPLC